MVITTVTSSPAHLTSQLTDTSGSRHKSTVHLVLSCMLWLVLVNVVVAAQRQITVHHSPSITAAHTRHRHSWRTNSDPIKHPHFTAQQNSWDLPIAKTVKCYVIVMIHMGEADSETLLIVSNAWPMSNPYIAWDRIQNHLWHVRTGFGSKYLENGLR